MRTYIPTHALYTYIYIHTCIQVRVLDTFVITKFLTFIANCNLQELLFAYV